MASNKIQMSKEEFERLYEVKDEVEQELTQPKIEDNIDNPELLTQEEEAFDTAMHKDLPVQPKEEEE